MIGSDEIPSGDLEVYKNSEVMMNSFPLKEKVPMLRLRSFEYREGGNKGKWRRLHVSGE